MEELIKKLKKQHWELNTIFESLDNFCKGEAQKEWVKEKGDVITYIRKLKITILGHVKLETKELYPPLLQSEDKKIKDFAQKNFDEMNLIAEEQNEFFEKYAQLKQSELSSNLDFKLDLTKIIKIFKKRMALEEGEIFPMYEELV